MLTFKSRTHRRPLNNNLLTSDIEDVALCSLLCAPASCSCSLLLFSALFSVLPACIVLCVLYSALCSLCFVLCALCSVLLAPCSLLTAPCSLVSCLPSVALVFGVLCCCILWLPGRLMYLVILLSVFSLFSYFSINVILLQKLNLSELKIN